MICSFSCECRTCRPSEGACAIIMRSEVISWRVIRPSSARPVCLPTYIDERLLWRRSYAILRFRSKYLSRISYVIIAKKNIRDRSKMPSKKIFMTAAAMLAVLHRFRGPSRASLRPQWLLPLSFSARRHRGVHLGRRSRRLPCRAARRAPHVELRASSPCADFQRRRQVAFIGQHEGPSEVRCPRRRRPGETHLNGDRSAAWAPDGRPW